MEVPLNFFYDELADSFSAQELDLTVDSAHRFSDFFSVAGVQAIFGHRENHPLRTCLLRSSSAGSRTFAQALPHTPEGFLCLFPKFT